MQINSLKMMMFAAIACPLVCALPILAQEQSRPQPGAPPMTEQPPSTEQPPMNGPAGPMQTTTHDDQKFVHEAAMGGMTEVEVGKLAQQKSSNDAVKQFGQKLEEDHTKANDQLKQAATKDGLTVPDTLDSKHQGMIDKLSGLSGDAFDKAFAKNAVKDHQKDIKAFKREAKNGTHPNVKNFAAETLPVLQQHLSMAKDLNKQSKGAASKGAASTASADQQ